MSVAYHGYYGVLSACHRCFPVSSAGLNGGGRGAEGVVRISCNWQVGWARWVWWVGCGGGTRGWRWKWYSFETWSTEEAVGLVREGGRAPADELRQFPAALHHGLDVDRHGRSGRVQIDDRRGKKGGGSRSLRRRCPRGAGALEVRHSISVGSASTLRQIGHWVRARVGNRHCRAL